MDVSTMTMAERNSRIITMRAGGMTCAAIGREVALTEQRVHQIVKAHQAAEHLKGAPVGQT